MSGYQSGGGSALTRGPSNAVSSDGKVTLRGSPRRLHSTGPFARSPASFSGVRTMHVRRIFGVAFFGELTGARLEVSHQHPTHPLYAATPRPTGARVRSFRRRQRRTPIGPLEFAWSLRRQALVVSAISKSLGYDRDQQRQVIRALWTGAPIPSCPFR